jgi:hypothetical protein
VRAIRRQGSSRNSVGCGQRLARNEPVEPHRSRFENVMVDCADGGCIEFGESLGGENRAVVDVVDRRTPLEVGDERPELFDGLL